MEKSETPASILKSICKNEDLLRAYASRKCKDCLGRGYIELATPLNNAEHYVCDCVKKRVNKEFIS
tara:strand:+ start:74 stop:271 length:198 start_codon:yes stop_codon:yes gene_type:complete